MKNAKVWFHATNIVIHTLQKSLEHFNTYHKYFNKIRTISQMARTKEKKKKLNCPGRRVSIT